MHVEAPNHVYACAQFIFVTLTFLAHLFSNPLLEAWYGSIRQVQVQLRQHSETLLLHSPVQKKGKKNPSNPFIMELQDLDFPSPFS